MGRPAGGIVIYFVKLIVREKKYTFSLSSEYILFQDFMKILFKRLWSNIDLLVINRTKKAKKIVEPMMAL